MGQMETNRKDVYLRGAGWFDIVIAVVTGAVTVLYVTKFGIKATTCSAKTSCIANLKQLDGAKASWALENAVTNNDTIPKDSDLFGMTAYIRDKPTCPQGGIYTIGSVGEYSRCSIPMHSYKAGDVYVNDESGNPLAGASVSVNGTKGYKTEANTDTNGFAYVNCWAGGATVLSISKSGYDCQRLLLTNYWPLKIKLQRSSLQSKL